MRTSVAGPRRPDGLIVLDQVLISCEVLKQVLRKGVINPDVLDIMMLSFEQILAAIDPIEKIFVVLVSFAIKLFVCKGS